jgi:phosphotransferase system enzyme I (PtsI)
MAPTALADVRAILLTHSLGDARRIAEAALAANDAAYARSAALAAATAASTPASSPTDTREKETQS